MMGGLARGFEIDTQRLLWEVDLAEKQSQRLVPWHVELRGNTLVAHPGRLYSPDTFRFAYIDPEAGELLYRSQPLEGPTGSIHLTWNGPRVAVHAGDRRWELTSRSATRDHAGVTLNHKD
jgi:hypothetical protein